MPFSRDEFCRPSADYRLDIFWLWNADATPSGIEMQLAEMKRAGIGGVFIHSMPDDFRKADFVSGMTIEYLSEAFFDRVKSAVRSAKELGMRIWIYDEGGWPSGHALQKVPAIDPEYRGSVLRLGRVTSDFQADPKNGRFAFKKDAGYCFQRSFDSSLGYRFPSDLLNPDVTDAFIKVTLEPYRLFLGDEFGKTIVGVFTDEPRYSGYVGTDEIPWTHNMLTEFKNRKGYDLEPYLGALFKKTVAHYPRDEVGRARIDYLDVCSTLFSDHYFKRVHDWCRKNSLLYAGHVSGEEDIHCHSLFTGSIFRSLKHFDIPGIDAIWRQVFKGGKRNNFPLYGAGACSLGDKNLLCSESFSVYGFGLTFEQMKWVTLSQYARGVNMICPMPFMYSRAEGRSVGLANDFFHDPKMEHFRAYSDYVARLNYFCRQGDRVASVAVYYPIRALWAGKDKALTESFDDMVRRLVARRVQFDIIDDDAVAEGLLNSRGYSHFVITAGSQMSEQAQRALERFVENGGKVVACEQFGQIDQELQPCIAVYGKTDGVVCIKRKTRDEVYCLLFNESGGERKFLVKASQGHEYYLADFDSGVVCRAHPADGTIGLTLRPGEGLGVLECRLPLDSVHEHCNRKKRIKPDVRVRCSELGRYIVDEKGIRFRKKQALEFEDGERLSADCFSGRKLYRIELNVELEWLECESVAIDFGKVKHFICLKVNGKNAGYRVWSPYTFEVKHLIRPGLNVLEAVVSNTLADLLYSEDTEEFLSRMGWKNAYYDRVKKFDRQSFGIGILGPITLFVGMEVWHCSF